MYELQVANMRSDAVRFTSRRFEMLDARGHVTVEQGSGAQDEGGGLPLRGGPSASRDCFFFLNPHPHPPLPPQVRRPITLSLSRSLQAGSFSSWGDSISPPRRAIWASSSLSSWGALALHHIQSRSALPPPSNTPTRSSIYTTLVFSISAIESAGSFLSLLLFRCPPSNQRAHSSDLCVFTY